LGLGKWCYTGKKPNKLTRSITTLHWDDANLSLFC
jgi:hypothetical protein